MKEVGVCWKEKGGWAVRRGRRIVKREGGTRGDFSHFSTLAMLKPFYLCVNVNGSKMI